MLKDLIKNSKLNWTESSNLPKCINGKSKDVILIFYDGFISRGYYNCLEESWYGYNTDYVAEKYYCDPAYYVLF